ncbi:MAG: D-sedoheptulose-7-phosphate isomerase [Terriglobales bacterium]
MRPGVAADLTARLEANFTASAECQRRAAATLLPALTRAAEALIAAYRGGGKAIFFGNGGSAADAQHLAAEFLGRYLQERPALPALALAVNTSTVTAIGNDYGYEQVFARQIAAWARPGDVAVGISTSGNSANVIAAIQAAQERGARTIALTGEGGGKLAAVAEILLAVPSRETPRIQECHILMGHALCQAVESALFPG